MNNKSMKVNNLICSDQLLVWITKTTRDGDTNSRIGIAEHIGGSYRELDMPNVFCTREQIKDRLVAANLITNKKVRWPDVLIGPCFHIPYMQEIKRLSGGKTLIVALRPPVRGLPIKASREDINRTDIIVSYPYHNNDNLPNLLLCETISNRITEDRLNEAKLIWKNDFLPFFDRGPVIGLLVGGDIGDKRRVFSQKIAADLGTRVNRIAEEMHGSIIVSMSARTPNECKSIICSKITVPNYVYDPKSTVGDNPYFGILGSVDYIIATADSISMCCESASSGKPVYIYYDQYIVESAHAEIVNNLIKSGCARLFSNLESIEKFSYAPTNSAKNVAKRAHEILLERKINNAH